MENKEITYIFDDTKAHQLIEEIKDYQSKNIYIITKEIELKISSILSILQKEDFDLKIKASIIKYINLLIKNIPYNLGIILSKKSECNPKMNLFEIIIDQYIFTDKEKKEYIKLLKEIINSIFVRLSFNKDVYYYIFSYVSKFFDDKIHNIENNFNEYNFYQLLELIYWFYQSSDDEDPINYFYFNGESNAKITLKNSSNELLKLDNNLYILLFVKLINYDYISPIIEKNGSNNNIISNLLEVTFKEAKKNFSININYKDSGETTTPDNSNIINIPYSLFKAKEINNILIKITPDLDIEIYTNGYKANLPSSSLKDINIRNKSIDSIEFFKGFYGLCSTIMIYKDDYKNKLHYLLPNYLLEKENNKDTPSSSNKSKYLISKLYTSGFHKEQHFTSFIKANIKDEVDEDNIKDNSITINKNEDDNFIQFKKFIKYNLISIYSPTRTLANSSFQTKIVENKQIEEIIKEILLIDSINNFHANLCISELYPNSIYGLGGGVRLLSNIINDFSIDVNGVNHLLPLIEIMTEYNELLTKDNFSMFISIILSIFSSHQDLISNEPEPKFFYHLSLFLEKIPETFYNDLAAHIKSIMVTLQCIESSDNQNISFFQEFFDHVIMNENILFKFSLDDRILIYDQIYKILQLRSDIKKNIDITNIINILLSQEKNKYTHFCCKKHADYFNKASQIMEPELNKYLEPLTKIIDLLINQFMNDFDNIEKIKSNSKGRELDSKANKEFLEFGKQLLKIFELLTFDITPCLQINILNCFSKIILNTNNTNNINSMNFINIINENYYSYLNANNKIDLILLYVFKTSLFDVKEKAFNILIEILNNNQNFNEIQKYIQNYSIYYYYPQIDENKENMNNIQNFGKELQIDGIKYLYQPLTENQKQLLKYYDKKHFNNLMNAIFDAAAQNFVESKYIETNFNVLLNLVSRGDSLFIYKFLGIIQPKKRFNQNENQINLIYQSKKLLNWLLDTCYQAYMIKKYNYNEKEFVPGFSFGEFKDEKEKENRITNIITLTNNLLFDIFYKDIYKLDYLMTWSKYYYEIKKDKHKLAIRHFIFDNFLKEIIIKFSEKKIGPNKNITQDLINSLYFANILFEYFTFHKTNGFESGNTLKDPDLLHLQFYHSFVITLFSEFKSERNDKDKIYLLKEEWEDYSIIKKFLNNSELFGLTKLNPKLYEEKNIYKAHIDKKNDLFIEDLKALFFNNFNNGNTCNKGMELIILKYHYFTLLLTVITDSSEFRQIIDGLRTFILLIIISSSTLSFNKNNKKSQKWPTEEDFNRIQHLVKIILFNIFDFLNKSIIEINKKIQKYKSKDDSESKTLSEHFHKIKSYLINTLFFLLSVLNGMYSELKKGPKKKKFSLSKLRRKSNDNIIQSTGGYKYIDEFISSCLIEKKPNDNEIKNMDWEDYFIDIEEKNFLDEIPPLYLNSINEKDYEKTQLNSQLEKIYSNNYENNKKIIDYFNENRDNNQKEMFPFINCILKRSELICNIIPTYDNSLYTQDYDFLCLKPYYLPKLPSKDIKMEKIEQFSSNLIDEIRMYQIKVKFNENDKIRQYRKIKKKIFSFNGILSSKKYFYEKNKYICKYKLLNHMTEDYTKMLLTPIIDMDYYLPKFSKFKIDNLFRNENKDNLIQIKKITNLELTPKLKNKNKEQENIDFNNCSGLYLIKESEFKYMSNLNLDIEGTYDHYEFYKKYIRKKHNINDINNNCLENACLVKTEFHIRGIFYNNNNEIGFYSYDEIPYPKGKKRENIDISDEKISEIQYDYDQDRKSCFGSVFSPQNEKYKYLHFKIPYNEIVFIFKRRYYYKVSAIEVFTTRKKSYFFRFAHNRLDDIIKKIKNNINSREINIEFSKFYSKIGLINENSINNNMNKEIYEKNVMNLKSIYEKWKNWEISTIRLLMLVNIYANRSYNDVNQYPVFPWIIIDYQSDEFPKEINSTKVSRPLDTPMGMLTINSEAEQRRQDYMDHWEISKDDEDREDEFDRYGSHYSTALYVSYYLVRVFPFANVRIELQGSSFDDPNRLFNTMEASFYCASTQKSDLRELIPELFCFPEMLLNNNDFNLGEIKDPSTKEQKMKIIQEVVAPKWCKNNAYDFIKKHRELLESFEISSHLNEWLNLIFGSLQKGPAANKIHNLYNRQTYEDYEKTFNDMSLNEKEITCRMAEFGLTPHQIFKHDASQRKVNLDTKIKRQIFFNVIKNYKLLGEKECKNNITIEEIIGDISFYNPLRIYYFPKDKEKKNIYIMNNYELTIYSRKREREREKEKESNKNDDDQNMIVPYDIEGKYILKIEKKEEFNLTNFKYGIKNSKQINIWLDNGKILAKGGYWNGNIILKKVIYEKEKKEKEKENQNNNNIIKSNDQSKRIYIYTTSEYSPIMNMVIDKNETFAICGNTIGTIFIFKISPNNKMIWMLYKNFNDHNSPISSIAINETLNISITCSQNGLCMLYTLPYFNLYNSFIIGKDDKESENQEEIICPDLVLISDSPLPCFIFYIDLKRSLYFYSINGHLLNKKKLDCSLKGNTIKIYRDYQFVDYILIYNSINKAFELYSMIDFVLIQRLPISPDDNYELIDFDLTEDLDHILFLCRNKTDGKYKLFIMREKEKLNYWK